MWIGVREAEERAGEERKWAGTRGVRGEREKRTSQRKWEERHWRLWCYQVPLLIWQPQSSLTEQSACHLPYPAILLCGTAQHWAPLSLKALFKITSAFVSIGFILSGILSLKQSLKGFSCPWLCNLKCPWWNTTTGKCFNRLLELVQAMHIKLLLPQQMMIPLYLL